MTKKLNETAKAVMKKIKKGEIKMRPRAYFVIGSILLGVGLVGVMMLTVMFSGMVFFRLRMQGALGYLRFGQMGFPPFIKVFPWKVVGLTGLGLIGGFYLLRKQGKAYKIGLGWLVLGVVMAILALGFLMDKAGVNERLQRGPVPALYEMRFKDEDWLVGEIKEASESGLVVVTPEGEEIKVALDDKVKGPVNILKSGDKVRIIGEMENEIFEAEGIMPGGLRWDGPPPPRSEMEGRMKEKMEDEGWIR